jgi:probable HAF family extracellular repeat protein
MKSSTLICFAAMTLSAVLAIPVQLAAQHSQDNHKHHHYKLIDFGTFGGPSSYFNSLTVTDVFQFPTVFYNIAQVRNAQGVFVGFADTSTPDPYPAFCYVPDCFVTHAFQWRNGVETDLGTLPGGASSAAFWINSKGWITGNSENGETDPLIPGLPEIRAVLWKDGTIRDLGTLGGNTSFAQAINDRGQVTGLALNGTPDPYSYYYLYLHGSSGGTQTRGFVWDEETGMQDIGTLGGANAFPSVMNDRGQVAGFSDTSFIADPNVGIPPLHPFLWEKEKGMKDLGSFGGVETASVNGLNERGQVVGGLFLPGEQQIHPFLWSGKKLIDLTTAPFGGPGNGEARWINEGGEIVGGAELALPCADREFQMHGFLWKTGVMMDLGMTAGNPNSQADFINSKTQIVGGSFSCEFGSPTAFLWEDGSMVDLNTLISYNSPPFLYWASFIDDHGEIGAFATLPDGDSHAVWLIPCDENHPGAEGCDYSLADTAAAVSRPSPAVGAPPVVPPENIRQMLQRRMGLRQHWPGYVGPRN